MLRWAKRKESKWGRPVGDKTTKNEIYFLFVRCTHNFALPLRWCDGPLFCLSNIILCFVYFAPESEKEIKLTFRRWLPFGLPVSVCCYHIQPLHKGYYTLLVLLYLTMAYDLRQCNQFGLGIHWNSYDYFVVFHSWLIHAFNASREVDAKWNWYSYQFSGM